MESAPSNVLDIGCGTGRLLRKVRQCWPNAKLTGVDLSEGMISKARQLMPDATFIVCPAESLTLPDSSADLVLSTMSFHHWSDQPRAMREVKRVLCKGGLFILSDVTVPSFLSKAVHHGHMRNASEVKKMFEQAGLTVLSQRHILLGHILVTVGTWH